MFGVLLEMPNQLVSVHSWQSRVCQDEIRCRDLNLRQGIYAVGCGGYNVASLLETDLQHTNAARIRVD